MSSEAQLGARRVVEILGERRKASGAALLRSRLAEAFDLVVVDRTDGAARMALSLALTAAC